MNLFLIANVFILTFICNLYAKESQSQFFTHHEVKQILYENGIKIEKEWDNLVFQNVSISENENGNNIYPGIFDILPQLSHSLKKLHFWPTLTLSPANTHKTTQWDQIDKKYIWEKQGNNLLFLIKMAIKSYFQPIAFLQRMNQEDPFLLDFPQMPIKIEKIENGFKVSTLSKLAQEHELLNEKRPKFNKNDNLISWHNIFLKSLIVGGLFCIAHECLIDFSNFAQATKTNSLYGKILNVQPVNNFGINHGHVSQLYAVELVNYQRAIFKPSLPRNDKFGNYKNEIAAYKISELFHLDGIVPQTIFKAIQVQDKYLEGSLQSFITDATHPTMSKESIRNILPNEINFLDLILANADRHANNVLQKYNRNGNLQFFAIDNDKSFHSFDKPASYTTKVMIDFLRNPEKFFLSSNQMIDLKKITKNMFEDTLTGLISTEQIHQAQNRFDTYIQLYSLYNDEVTKIQNLADVIGSNSKQGQSKQGSKVITLKSGLKAIFKWDTPNCVGTYKNEIAAYKISQLLGYNKVPPTIKRSIHIDGEEITGSLQLFKTNTYILYPDKIHFRDFDHPADVHFFDFILGQFNRHNGNIILDSFNSEYFLVDHSNTLMSKSRHAQLIEHFHNSPTLFKPTNKNILDIFCTSKSNTFIELIDPLVIENFKPLLEERLKLLFNAYCIPVQT